MLDIIVKYNNTQIFPTPLVNHNYQMIDLNNSRWGNVEPIELQGYLTGIASTGDFKRITQIFTGNFGNLLVTDGQGNTLYNWNNIVVEDISFDSSKWPIGGFVTYKVGLKSFNFPSGVIDASNLYDFTHNQDGTVTVNHKITAKGVQTNFGALDNAISFVGMFTGKNPYNNCIPSFVPVGNGVLLSLTENINRLEQSYTVTEQYKYSTGSLADYISIDNLHIDASTTKEYITFDYNIKYLTSPITGNLNNVTSIINNTNYLDRIGQNFGIDTTMLYLDTSNIVQDTGAGIIDVKLNYISGVQNFNDSQGFFDYAMTVESDYVHQLNVWKIEGEFISKGPLSLRKTNLNNWKITTLANNQSYENYLYALIRNDVFYVVEQGWNINIRPISFSINENSGLATFKMQASFNDIPNPFQIIQPKFKIDFEPPKWAFEAVPAANIEGHYVVQDLQMKTAPKIAYSLSAGISGENDDTISNLLTQFSYLTQTYMDTGYLTHQTVVTGFNEVSLEFGYIANNLINSPNSTALKICGSFASNYVRPAGYQFGY